MGFLIPKATAEPQYGIRAEGISNESHKKEMQNTTKG